MTKNGMAECSLVEHGPIHQEAESNGAKSGQNVNVTSDISAYRVTAPTVMTMKRSISPDGRIDCFSLVFSSPVENANSAEIIQRATQLLRIQNNVTSLFLHADRQSTDYNGSNGIGGSRPATMLYIGSVEGRYGPRLFIAFQANGRGLKLFGTAKELANAILSAGYDFGAGDITAGTRLDLPCRVVTKPSPNGRYTDVDQLLPIDDNMPNDDDRAG
jgi:hypothetical protein